ncbi:MAG: GSCFA domain-containing protein [Chitinophagales bacterium]|nr:GSCFA domain-containing protein [Chitinophagales bacterium]
MEFSTKITITPSSNLISHQHNLWLIGSCFTENIGDLLKEYQFQTYQNSHGIIYNPISIFNAIDEVSSLKIYIENDLLKQNELYVSLNHHGKFSGLDKNAVLAEINVEIEKANTHFKKSDFVVITLGTSFVYEYADSKKIVANCHKIPNTKFTKRLLKIEEIVATFDSIQSSLKEKKIIFTVSPVRHWRDGAVENQRSKSILIESIHQIIEQHSNCFYFPAYEIMMDELRDYRFYEKDMLHPNSVAVEYIWQRFSETYFSAFTQTLNQQIAKINLLLQHRIKHENTNEQKQFEALVKKSIEKFKEENPDLKLNF